MVESKVTIEQTENLNKPSVDTLATSERILQQVQSEVTNRYQSTETKTIESLRELTTEETPDKVDQLDSYGHNSSQYTKEEIDNDKFYFDNIKPDTNKTVDYQ